jgi:hypothetical protein
MGKYFVYSGAQVATIFPLRASAPDGRRYNIAGLILTIGARRVAFARNSASLVFLRGGIDPQEFLALESADRNRAAADRFASKPRDRRFRRFTGRLEIVFVDGPVNTASRCPGCDFVDDGFIARIEELPMKDLRRAPPKPSAHSADYPNWC